MTCALVILVLGKEGVVMNTIPGYGSEKECFTASGKVTSAPGVSSLMTKLNVGREAPVGHRQPKAGEVP